MKERKLKIRFKDTTDETPVKVKDPKKAIKAITDN